MKIRAFIFDLDGTLLDTIPLIRLSFEKVFSELAIPWGHGEVLKTIGLPLQEVARQYAPGRVEEFLRIYSAYQRSRHQELTRLFPGTRETLESLVSSGYRTGVVTSKRRAPAAAGLALTGIDRYIEVTVTVEDIVRPKPDPESVIRALELLNTRPEQAVYVGDSWYDIEAGRRAGVKTIGVTWGMATREELLKAFPDSIIDNWEELYGSL
ncbi:MAG: HAD-IA family hydrolase [Syntrophomonadaceae bacterium]|nr:HAD-IA family hydrolase [Syntrophomonadaceae bacterium]